MTDGPAAERLTPDPALAVNAALFAGQKVEAINLYRRTHRVDLVTAKRAVEAVEASLRQSHSNQFKYPPGRSGGCGGRLLLFVVVVVLIMAGVDWLIHLL